jgi:hypothetical protein
MVSIPATPSQDPEYAWELATLYPEQGEWSEEEYLESLLLSKIDPPLLS